MNKKRRYAISALLCAASALPLIAAADTQFVALDQNAYQGTQLQGIYSSGTGGTALSFVLNHFLLLALSVLWTLVIFRWMYAAYLIGFSGDSWEKQGRARQIISDSTIWALAATAVVLIFQIIDPCMLDLTRIFNDFSANGGASACTT